MKRLDKEKSEAIAMRLSGMSYSQIKLKINVSKSTLSLWLEKYPLSVERIRVLRDLNPQRIEKSRNTKFKKRQDKLNNVFNFVKKDIGHLSKRELFLAGMFLYWGEGTKAARDIVACTNTDPAMIRFFIKWIESVGVSRRLLKVKLHLYVDMDIKEGVNFWSRELGISKNNFRKPYIKNSKFSSLTYKNSFGHGTCTVSYGNTDLHNRVMMGLKYIREVVSK